MENLVNTIHNCDSVPFMNNLPEKVVDLIVTDPPYGINFGKGHGTYNRNDDLVLDGYIDIDPAVYPQFSKDWITAATRILKDDGSFYIVSGHTHIEFIMTAAREAGLILRDQIIWQYPFGVFTSKKYVTSHYTILHYCKDLKKVKFYGDAREKGKASYHDRVDVWEINRENNKGVLKPPTCLPRELVKKMIEYSSVPGDLVFDGFLGGGTTAFVAKEIGRKYLGTELCKNYYDLASKRLSTGQYLIKSL